MQTAAIHPSFSAVCIQNAETIKGKSSCGNVRSLVNNAALEFAPAPVADIDEELYDAVMAVNAKSTFL